MPAMHCPNFFIVGAPKCGTTALSDYLRGHPNIFMSVPKEPSFFADDFPGIQFVRKQEAYLKLFAKRTRVQFAVGEASPAYFFSGTAIANIRAFNDDAKLIVMLRNPVEMLVSYHAQLVYSLFETVRDFETAWHLQDERARGKAIPKTCREPNFLQYRHVASFGLHLQRIMDIFPRKQIHVILFEDFVRDTRGCYREVLDYLGVPLDDRADFPIVNQRKSYVSARINQILHLPPDIFYRILNRSNGSPLYHFFLKSHELIKQANSRPTDTIHIAPRLRRRIVCELKNDMLHLSRLLQKDLAHWTYSSDG